MVQVSRALDSPLTTRDCAAYMGYSREWVRRAITVGIPVGAARVQLDAETLTLDGKRRYRIHRDHFRTFLIAIGWSRLPALPLPLFLPAAS
jgi:hypothetical protein